MIAPVLVVILVGFGCAWWAWSYQQRALRVLRLRPSHVETAGATAPVVATRRDRHVRPEPEMTSARVAVQQLERPSTTSPSTSSVLGWEAFALVSTLVLDGTVLLGCRRRAGEQARPVPAEEATLVLLIGDDDRSILAVAMLEGWRQAEATLRLRPTTVAGAIEVFDGRRSAIRAALLAT